MKFLFRFISADPNRTMLRSLGPHQFSDLTGTKAKRNYADNVSEYNAVLASLNATRRPGVTAGKAAGMEVVAVPSVPKQAHLYISADEVINSLLDLQPEKDRGNFANRTLVYQWSRH
ncbi:hypothetical protein ES319_A03G160600v1 [Gossypium barbadense]|uniref:Uncharacterized protein n=6 Tax=Gossypium TaxID=3633 RepID=A0A5J5WEF5_GOSBA|nr:hypothetical protein ES319_A03G160600v1 [Gossypium barbadense]KAB2090998.1 hypothetical protein ES319_A03G160600v1 [Gossypium barbadense]TYH25603.1 hypothetical protein ES288_A03G182500v1 [Gossypium darwinii]TYH25605.1 hypothetical protein ES288_A03G182500v1 [Gossypium darwinii]